MSTVAVVMWRVQGGYLAAHEARPDIITACRLSNSLLFSK